MALILNIDTATERASVSLALDGVVLQERVNDRSFDHAGWIHTAIKEILSIHQVSTAQVSAIAVVAGPGSYTGLRVGMATAKGLCYAWKTPLISLNTLLVLAHATVPQAGETAFICPMLDARRMEVFTALYNSTLAIELAPCAMVLEEHSFGEWLNNTPIIFTGSGSVKWKEITHHPHAIFKDLFYQPADIALLAYQSFCRSAFDDLAYTEPLYLKEFYSPIRK